MRHVNEGYARLREHLPDEPTDKRMSKVETLRAAIRYIKHLESLLDVGKDGKQDKNTEANGEKTRIYGRRKVKKEQFMPLRAIPRA